MKFKRTRIGALVLLMMLIAGCSPSPVASGKIVRVTMGLKPVPRPGEGGNWSAQTFTQGRVRIYPNIVIVTEPDGTRHCAPPDWCSEITFK